MKPQIFTVYRRNSEPLLYVGDGLCLTYTDHQWELVDVPLTPPSSLSVAFVCKRWGVSAREAVDFARMFLEFDVVPLRAERSPALLERRPTARDHLPSLLFGPTDGWLLPSESGMEPCDEDMSGDSFVSSSWRG